MQVPSIKDNRRRAEGEEEDEAKKSKVDVSGFPVVDFDPVGRFLEELRITFGHFADFYYGRSAGPVVGVKLRPFVVDQVRKSESLPFHSMPMYRYLDKCGLFNISQDHELMMNRH